MLLKSLLPVKKKKVTFVCFGTCPQGRAYNPPFHIFDKPLPISSGHVQNCFFCLFVYKFLLSVKNIGTKKLFTYQNCFFF